MNSASLVLLAAGLVGSAHGSPSPRAVVRAMFDAFNRHDAAAMARLYASDARLASSDFCAVRTGPNEVLRTYRELFAAFPDIRDDVISIVIDGDQAAVRFTSSSDAPEHKFRLELMTYFRFGDRLIVEDDTIFDTQGRPCES